MLQHVNIILSKAHKRKTSVCFTYRRKKAEQVITHWGCGTGSYCFIGIKLPFEMKKFWREIIVMVAKHEEYT